jgi:hypothetical protein
MYISRIITTSEIRAGNNETESERRFLKGIEGQGGAIGQLRVKPGRAHYATVLQEQRRGGHARTGPRGAGPGAHAQGTAAPPRGTALAHLARTDSIDGEEDGAGVRSGIFPLQPPISTLYKKGEAPPNTHNTYHTPH